MLEEQTEVEGGREVEFEKLGKTFKTAIKPSLEKGAEVVRLTKRGGKEYLQQVSG